ncbi:MAG: hypothetical protein IKL94_02455 [Clostridia bacterium]|nr:hypothetical protein [Clostridia bacterium]
MNKITAHKALSMIALPNGIMYAYCIDKTDNIMKVGYKMISFESGKISNVSKSIFTLAKFGAAYKSFERKIKNYLTCSTVLLENGEVFIVELDGSALMMTSDGSELWSGKMLYQGSAPSSVSVTDGSLWAAFASKNVIVKYNLKNLREELRIGGENSVFNIPVNLFPAGKKLFVCNSGNNEIWKLDVSDYSTEKYYEFKEPLLDYTFVGKYEIVALETGIYLL